MFVHTGFLFFSAEFLTIFLQERKSDCKFDLLIFTFCGNCSVMKLNDFFCNCKTQSCTSASGTSCNIKTIKLFKNAYKLFFWNGIAAIGKLNTQIFTVLFYSNMNRAVIKAIIHCISQQIIKNALHFIDIALYHSVWDYFKLTF